MGRDKKVGDWVVLYDDEVYQIKDIPEVFKSNAFATQHQINKQKEIEKL